MNAPPTARRTRVRGVLAALLFVAAGSLVLPAESFGQRRPPIRRPPPVAGDTVAPPDTTAVVSAQDTAAAGAEPAAPDTTPILQLPRLPGAGTQGWHAGVWTWDRADLLASGALTLTDLLERIPGVTAVRYGFVGLPETVSSLGGDAGTIELLLDGFALDPLGEAGLDLSRFELAELASVRVERRLGSLRIELETLSPPHNSPYSRIEAGTGDYRTNLLRGLFLAPRLLGGSIGLGVERLASEGWQGREPVENFGGWAKWTLTGPRLGLQLEYRRSSISREGEAFGRFEGRRDDVVLRTRAEPLPGLAAEAYVGRSAVDDALDGTTDTLRTQVSGVQAGLRTGIRREAFRAATSLRLRNERGLPAWDGEVAAGATLGGFLTLDATHRLADWREGQRAASTALRAQAGPFLGIRPLAEWFDGKNGTPWLADTAGVPILTRRSGYRAGFEAEYGRLLLGAAGAVLETGAAALPVAGLGQPALLYPGGRVEGWEVVGRIPSPWRILSVEGSYTRWVRGQTWIYLPKQSGRAGLVLHTTPLSSGSLEILARIEARQRGAMLVPDLTAPDGGSGGTGDGTDGGDDGGAPPALAFDVAPAATTFDFYLLLRIKDVRAFLRWENLANRTGLYDVVGRELPGQRIFYGVKWHFLD